MTLDPDSLFEKYKINIALQYFEDPESWIIYYHPDEYELFELCIDEKFYSTYTYDTPAKSFNSYKEALTWFLSQEKIPIMEQKRETHYIEDGVLNV